VRNKAAVETDGVEKEIPVDEVVPGDIILLNAGDIIPADCYIIQSNVLLSAFLNASFQTCFLTRLMKP
jgi:Mg2+-importing ATPase